MMTDFAPVHRQASVWPGAVAVVGLGQMGLPIALRLLAAAFRVTGCRRREPPAPFLAAGGRGCSSPAQAADSCPVVLTLLPSAEALVSAVTGELGLASTTRRNGIWVEMSTVPETVKRSLAERMAERGWSTLDCPISGAPVQLEAGEAVLLSSGQRATHDRVKPVLQAISPRVSYLGEFGRGIRAKYTAHLLLSGHSLVAAEALAFARAADLNIAEVLDALKGTLVSSYVFDHRAHRVLDAPDTPAASSLPALADLLARLHRFAAELHTPTPVLDQTLTHLDGREAQRTDELVVALYRDLTAGSALQARPQPKQEHS
jgi:L-threonate 2-dehydrogenase